MSSFWTFLHLVIDTASSCGFLCAKAKIYSWKTNCSYELETLSNNTERIPRSRILFMAGLIGIAAVRLKCKGGAHGSNTAILTG